MNTPLKLFLYVCCWIVAWLLFSTIIDYGLITTKVYDAGEKGKLFTYLSGGAISFAGAFSLYNEVFTE